MTEKLKFSELRLQQKVWAATLLHPKEREVQKEESKRRTWKRGAEGPRYVLGLVDHFHICLRCNRGVGLSQRVVCVQLAVG